MVEGQAKGPAAAIIRASPRSELFDEHLWYEPFRQIDIVTFDEPK